VPFGIFFLVSIVISAVLSLPTLIIQLVVNSKNVYQESSKRKKAVNLSHLIIFLVTLLVGNLIITLTDDGWMYAIFSGATTLYAIVATIIWAFILKYQEQENQ
jgi:SNF family Na+-dependent transporter